MNSNTPTVPDAEILIATGCAHCAVVVEGLTQLLKEGLIGQLRIINIVPRPERAQALGVRSVPWTQLGPFILEGQHSPAELRKWAKAAGSVEGMAAYITGQLKEGKLGKLEKQLAHNPEGLHAVIPLLENEDTEMQVRIGIDAILESLAGEALAPLIPELIRLSEDSNPRIRGDATHYLSLTENPEVIPALEKRLNDESEEIREIAAEGLAHINKDNTESGSTV